LKVEKKVDFELNLLPYPISSILRKESKYYSTRFFYSVFIDINRKTFTQIIVGGAVKADAQKYSFSSQIT
jgi:hypothetical protein